jgi:hypothetical protein
MCKELQLCRDHNPGCHCTLRLSLAKTPTFTPEAHGAIVAEASGWANLTST